MLTILIVYSKNNCGPCSMVKGHLQRNGIEFEERNINESQEYMDEIAELGVMSVPIMVRNNKILLEGYQPQIMDKMFS